MIGTSKLSPAQPKSRFPRAGTWRGKPRPAHFWNFLVLHEETDPGELLGEIRAQIVHFTVENAILEHFSEGVRTLTSAQVCQAPQRGSKPHWGRVKISV